MGNQTAQIGENKIVALALFIDSIALVEYTRDDNKVKIIRTIYENEELGYGDDY